MAYKIINRDPFPYRKQIIKLWEENLPDATQSRLDWLNNSPNGTSIWFFAFKNNSNDISGMISVLPHVIYENKVKKFCGIIGDIVVNKQDRGHGLCLKILKHILSEKEKFRWDILYVIPNEKAKKSILKAGFINVGNFKTFVKPIKFNAYKKHIKKQVQFLPIFQIISDFLISASGYFIPKILLINIRQVDIFKKYKIEKKIKEKYGSEKINNIDYLKWRLNSNPNIFFGTLLNRNNYIIGLIIFKVLDKKIYILSINSIKWIHSIELLSLVFKYCHRKNRNGIYIDIFGEKYKKIVKMIGMFDTGDDADVYCYGDLDINFNQKEFHLFSIDRNLQF